jgi:hypothetical protein
MDSFCKSMDLYQFEGHESRLKKIWFVSWITNPDLKSFGLYCDHETSQFSKDFDLFSQIQQILTNPYESLQIQILNFWFVDSFWKKKFPNYLIYFVLEGFIYDSRILRKYTI